MRRMSSCLLRGQGLHEVDEAEDEDDGQDADHEARHGAGPDPVYPVQLLLRGHNQVWC